ncbi:MAG: ABC transporter ATP-binding protein [Proteobacteria bacterium]|nr:ABC transporter ATP-binding protein [Pseudomonadota bacterium]
MVDTHQSIGVSLQNISKKFDKSEAVKQVNLDFEPGTLTSLLGPSGCGKTTILRMISGLEIPTTGKIFFGEEDVTSLSATNRDVGLVFQSYALFPHMNVGKNISYGLKLLGKGEDEIRDRVKDVLDVVGLKGFEGRFTDEMSGGQQQRVAVARALILKPKVLLFDEPLSNIDSKLRRSMREDIRRLQLETGITSIYVTHDQSEALAVSDEVVVMNVGIVEHKGRPEDLYRKPKTPFVATFIGDANIVEGSLSNKNGEPKIELGGFETSAYFIPDSVKEGPVKVTIRPETIHLHKEMGDNRMKGTVKTGSYVGASYEYTIDTEIGDLFVVETAKEEHFDHDEQVYLSVSRLGVAILAY